MDGPLARFLFPRSYGTTVEDLWDAVTNRERIPRWFLPVSGELQPGGRYQLEGNAGGVIMACEQLSHFTLTWEFGEDVSWMEGALLGRWCRWRPADPHAHPARFRTLG